MPDFLLITIAIAATLSLLSYVYCWHDITTGRPHIISLRQITNIMDRNHLNQIFGKHDDRYRYHLPPPLLKAFIAWRQGFYYREIAADALCLFGSYAYLRADIPSPMLGWFILLAGACQAINFAYSIHLVRKWGHQIREEMGDFDN